MKISKEYASERHFLFFATENVAIRTEEEFMQQVRALKEEVRRLEDRLEALTQSEKRLQVLLRNSSDIQVILDENGIEQYISDSVKAITGYPPEYFKGKSGFEFVHPDDVASTMKALERLHEGSGRFVQADYRHRTKDGSWVHLEAVGTNLLHDPLIKGIVLNVRDITEQKQAEKALKNSEEKYRTIVESIEDGYFEVDLAGNYTFFNEAMSRMTGYSSNEMMGMGYRRYMDDMDARKVFEGFNQVYRTGKPIKGIDWKLIRKDGSVAVVETSVSLIRDSAGEPVGFRGVARDITLAKEAEQALRESEEKYRTTFQGSPDSITITRLADGRYIEVNNGFCNITGFSREEALGKTPDDLNVIVHPEDRVAFVRKLKQDGRVDGFEMQYRAKDGAIFDTLFAARPLRYANEACLVAVVKDITQIKRAAREKARLEKQLQHAQRMKALGTLAGGIAHDFNNLLMGIQGRTSLMLLGKDPSHPDVEHLKGIETYVKDAADLTRQLLGFARGGKYEVKTTDINRLVKNGAEAFARTRKEIAIYGKYQEGLWSVESDRGQLNQVLVNILVNAWQAMPDGGDIFLETKNIMLDSSDIEPFELAPGPYVRISITDTGTGMDKAIQQRIFDPFFTTKEMNRGTGLGLASVYGIIQNHSGFINVYSEPGQGATFSIYLPAAKTEAEAEKPEADKGPARGSETLLLVDDEEMIRDVGREMLEAIGYHVLTASGGVEAIAMYERNPNGIHLVILDMIMPDKGGGETFDRLREIDPDVKVILSSGYSLDGQASEILKRGCDGFIQKPFNLDQLSQKLRKLLNE